MDAIKIVYLGFYLGFNLFFAVFFIIGIRMIIKWIYFKNRKKNFTVPAKIKYVNRTKLRSKISGWEYRYTYKVKAQGATVESTRRQCDQVLSQSGNYSFSLRDILQNPIRISNLGTIS